MRGSLTRRGKHSWRLKFDVGTGPDGKRVTKYLTVRGMRKDAERKLAETLNAHHTGSYVDATKTTVAEFAQQWMATRKLQQRTRERYEQLLQHQILPVLGNVRMQALRPIAVATWHNNLLRNGGKGGRPLSARTVGHCHRLLHVIFASAFELELVARNPVGAVRAPKVEHEEIEILQAADIDRALAALKQTQPPFPCVVTVALLSGCRRGELLGLAWDHIDLDAGTLQIKRSLGQSTNGELYFKQPKTKAGIRTVNLPTRAIEALRAHRAWQLEMRMRVGIGGKPELVFADLEGNPMSPNALSRQWGRFVRAHGLPHVSFHALRHTSVSMLINGGLDPVSIAKRIGHANAAITLRIYAHAFKPDDRAPAILDAALGTVHN
jgi:integrase